MSGQHEQAAKQGELDAMRGRYAPPKHYGTQLSGSIRRAYILAYLASGGMVANLSNLDRVHSGI
jgi:hypothetical protein